MKALLLREIKSFFGSLIGYLVIAVFLLLSGLSLWVFEGENNLLNSGFADLTPFFKIAPWILLFLIPATTMRSFSDEKKQGTIELLLTKPLTLWEIVTGKFLGAFLLLIISIIPTLLYVLVISNYVLPSQDLDFGSIIGSYFGLLFLAASYIAIGLFSSSITDNQIIAFIIALLICFLLYFGFDGFASLLKDNESAKSLNLENIIASIGMDYHYKSMSRGVIDTRDLVYFSSICVLFLSATVYKLKLLKQ
jgi:ABC-2 type transport system permease protein